MPAVTLRLTLTLRGQSHRLTVTPEGFKLEVTGERRSVELPWTAFLEDDAALYSALYKSIQRRRAKH